MNNDNEIMRELLASSIAYIEVAALLKTNRGRGIVGGIEKDKLRFAAEDAKLRLVKAQNATLAALRKEAGK